METLSYSTGWMDSGRVSRATICFDIEQCEECEVLVLFLFYSWENESSEGESQGQN